MRDPSGTAADPAPDASDGQPVASQELTQQQIVFMRQFAILLLHTGDSTIFQDGAELRYCPGEALTIGVLGLLEGMKAMTKLMGNGPDIDEIRSIIQFAVSQFMNEEHSSKQNDDFRDGICEDYSKMRASMQAMRDRQLAAERSRSRLQ